MQYKHQELIFNNRLSIGLNGAKNSPYGAFSDYVKLNPYWSPYDEDGKIRRYFEPFITGDIGLIRRALTRKKGFLIRCITPL